MNNNIINLKTQRTERAVKQALGTIRMLTNAERESYYLSLANSVTADEMKNEEHRQLDWFSAPEMGFVDIER